MELQLTIFLYLQRKILTAAAIFRKLAKKRQVDIFI